jgi:hypothetical protein
MRIWSKYSPKRAKLQIARERSDAQPGFTRKTPGSHEKTLRDPEKIGIIFQ